MSAFIANSTLTIAITDEDHDASRALKAIALRIAFSETTPAQTTRERFGEQRDHSAPTRFSYLINTDQVFATHNGYALADREAFAPQDLPALLVTLDLVS